MCVCVCLCLWHTEMFSCNHFSIQLLQIGCQLCIFGPGQVVIVIKYNTQKMWGIFGFRVKFQDKPKMHCNLLVRNCTFPNAHVQQFNVSVFWIQPVISMNGSNQIHCEPCGVEPDEECNSNQGTALTAFTLVWVACLMTCRGTWTHHQAQAWLSAMAQGGFILDEGSLAPVLFSDKSRFTSSCQRRQGECYASAVVTRSAFGGGVSSRCRTALHFVNGTVTRASYLNNIMNPVINQSPAWTTQAHEDEMSFMGNNDPAQRSRINTERLLERSGLHCVETSIS